MRTSMDNIVNKNKTSMISSRAKGHRARLFRLRGALFPLFPIHEIQHLRQHSVRVFVRKLAGPHGPVPATSVAQHQRADVDGRRPVQDAVTDGEDAKSLVLAVEDPDANSLSRQRPIPDPP